MAKVSHSHLLKQPGFGTPALDDVIPHTPENQSPRCEAPLLSESPNANRTGAYYEFVEAFFTGTLRKDPGRLE
jgi:hypothetical protein